MLIVPVYNMILTADATVFFQMDQLKRSAGGREISVRSYYDDGWTQCLRLFS